MENAILMRTQDIKTAAPFRDLFIIKSADLNRLISRMEKVGFDSAHPITVWAGHEALVIDGHTRLQAALTLGLQDVPVIEKNFATAEEALDYALAQQLVRRNLTQGEMFKYVHAVDKLKKTGPKKNLANAFAKPGKSSEELGKSLGISGRQIEKIRKIDREGTPDTKNALENNEITIRKAYNQTIHKEEQKQDDDLNLFHDENAGEKEISQEDRIRFTKKRRMKDIPETIENAIEERIKREKKNYPDIRYTEKELSILVAAVTEIAKKQLAQLA